MNGALGIYAAVVFFILAVKPSFFFEDNGAHKNMYQSGQKRLHLFLLVLAILVVFGTSLYEDHFSGS